jgi:uncharacterized glyoxalase superfamily protein PhnB
MSQSVRPIPEGHHTITPHLVVEGASEAIAFYEKAFGAREVCRMPSPDGKKIMHAELQIGDSFLYLADGFPEWGSFGPKESSPVTIHLYVEDADAFYHRAVEAGARPIVPLSDTFWGDRYGRLQDPFGHQWAVATHLEDVPPAEMAKRMEAAMGAC